MSGGAAGDDDPDQDEDEDDVVEPASPATAPPAPHEHRLIADAAAAGQRLDAAIAAAVPELSRAQVQRLIDDGQVRLAGAVASKAGARVRLGDAIEVRIPPPEPLEVRPEAIPLAILFEDADVIVIDKPAGMVVHPAAGHASGTLVNALLHHCTDLAGIGGVLRPGIVHRLDKDTSGVMIATKTERAHASLTAQFAAKSRGETGGSGSAAPAIERSYLAITSPAPPTRTGTLRTLYGRHPVHRKKFSSKVASGKSAVTHWEIVERLADAPVRGREPRSATTPPGPQAEAALVRFTLQTGRTHQIRVHASDAGWALLGDLVYGRKPRDARLADAARALGRQALHAHTLAFAHPATGERLAFTAPIPADFAAALAALRP